MLRESNPSTTSKRSVHYTHAKVVQRRKNSYVFQQQCRPKARRDNYRLAEYLNPFKCVVAQLRFILFLSECADLNKFKSVGSKFFLPKMSRDGT